MRHAGQVSRYGLAAGAFPQRQGQPGPGLNLLKSAGLDDAAQADRAGTGIGHLNTDYRSTRHRCLNPDTRRRQSQRQVIGQGGDSFHLYPRLGHLFQRHLNIAVPVLFLLFLYPAVPARLHPKLGDGRAGVYLYHFGVHAIAGQGIFNNLGPLHVIGLTELNLRSDIQNVNRRQLPAINGSQFGRLAVLLPHFLCHLSQLLRRGHRRRSGSGHLFLRRGDQWRLWNHSLRGDNRLLHFRRHGRFFFGGGPGAGHRINRRRLFLPELFFQVLGNGPPLKLLAQP